MDEQRLEALTVAMNRELYAEGVGLPYDQAAVTRYAAELEAEFRRGLQDDSNRGMALDGLAEMELTEVDLRLVDLMDATLVCADILVAGQPASWRMWKQAERELPDAHSRRELFSGLIEKSAQLIPLIVERYEHQRRVYASHATTPLEVFARREGLTPDGLRALALKLGNVCREPFQAALSGLAEQVFGPGEVTAAELRALYLNRMYAPLAPLFAERDPLADAQAVFAGLGFSLEAIALDFEDRPKKYAGAFCFPVDTPRDVRISIRPASPHHLADMLFHEFGHAVHFAGIDPSLSYADRYWISAGTHETFSTLFEMLLGLPGCLRDRLQFDAESVSRLAAFDRFKNLLTGTWQAAAGVTACDAWLEGLAWTEVERRLAEYLERFTGVPAPPGFARVHTYVSTVDPYPLGYVIAAVRVAHWLNDLQAQYGDRWWAEPRAGEAIRERIRQGGAVRFPRAWLDPAAFIERWVEAKG